MLLKLIASRLKKTKNWTVPKKRLFCEENDTRSGRRFACSLYPSHGPLRFITTHSRFALASTMRKTKRLRRRLGKRAYGCFSQQRLESNPAKEKFFRRNKKGKSQDLLSPKQENRSPKGNYERNHSESGQKIVCTDDRNSWNKKAYYEFSAVSSSGASSLGTSLSWWFVKKD